MHTYKEKLHNIDTLVFDYDGVLTNGVVLLQDDGEPLRTANVKDGYAIQYAARMGYTIAIISGGRSKTMETRFRMLNVPHVFLGAGNKLDVYSTFIKEQNIEPANVLYVGDDIPDIKVMEIAGLAVCPADAAEEVKEVADYVSHFKGGEGCVREIIEQVMKVQGKWLTDDAYFW